MKKPQARAIITPVIQRRHPGREVTVVEVRDTGVNLVAQYHVDGKVKYLGCRYSPPADSIGTVLTLTQGQFNKIGGR